MFSILRRCSCLRREQEDIKVLDFKHCGLADVPNEIFNFERTLEELYLDFNQIQDLPRPLFYCHELRKLGLSDNEIHSLPSAIASLINLEELDVCKNAILDIPDNIKLCKCLRILEASVNPLGKLPEGFTQLINLEELYLNDTFVDYLPANFGRLFKLKILELRENHLKCLPKSIARLTELSRLDIGQNDFRELPEVVGNLPKLSELWCDCNRISVIPGGIGNLKRLTYFDASKNRIESISSEIEGCINLTDVTLSSNNLKVLPETIGCLKNLEILRVDDNRLQKLPNSIGSLTNLEELVVNQNSIQRLPHGLGLLRKLHTLLLDENLLEELPPEVGSCVNLTILSARCNRLTVVPDELGHNSRLRIINFSDNRIRYLPYSLKKLKDLQALWLSENQNKPLIPLQGDIDIDTGQRVLTCYLLPQASGSQLDDYASDADSFQLSVWEEQRPQRQHIKFAYDEKLDKPGKLVRNPTPYPKELKAHVKHARNQALKSKGGANYVNINTLTTDGEPKSETVEPIVTTAVVCQMADTVTVKEAKVTKPSSPIISSDTHVSSSLHVNAKDKPNRAKTEQNEAAAHSKTGKEFDDSQQNGNGENESTAMNLSSDGVTNELESNLKNMVLDISGNANSSNAVESNFGDGSLYSSYGADYMKVNRFCPPELGFHSGYRSDHEVYENLRKEPLANNMALVERSKRFKQAAVSDGYASDLESSQRHKVSPFPDQFMTPVCSYNRTMKAASVSTAVAKKIFNDNTFNRPSLLNSHNEYFVSPNTLTRNNDRQEMDFNKSRNTYRLTHGPPPDLLPRNTGQMVIDNKNQMLYSSGGHQPMYPVAANVSPAPHNPVPLPPRRRPSNLNLFQVSTPAPMANLAYPPHVSPAVAPGFYLRPSPPSPFVVHGPPSPNRNRKPPPYHIATNYSKRAFIGPPSPVLKTSSVSFRPPSPLLTNNRLTPPPPPSNISSSQFRRSCHGSDPVLATRSNTPPSPTTVTSGSFRQRSHSSVNGAIVFDNPYVEEPCNTKRLPHYDLPSSPNRGNCSPHIPKQRFSPNFNGNEMRRGSLSAPSTPPPPPAAVDSNNSPTAQLPAYRTPPLYQSDSVGSLNGSVGGDVSEASKFVSHKRNLANGYHISGPRWPSLSGQEIRLDLVQEPQCGIFTALPVLVKSCSGADMNAEATDGNFNEPGAVYANMYASTGRLM